MSQDFYFIEKILDLKIKRGKKFYLIKWQGYPESDNSWEPSENINPILRNAYEMSFSSENDASVANTLKLQENSKNKNEVREKLMPDSDSDSENDESNLEAATSSEDEEELSRISQLPTEVLPEIKPLEPPQKKRVEKIHGYAKLKEEGKTFIIVKFVGSNNNILVLHDTFRYDYPQELIDFYETNTKWCDYDV